jgi:hypothetical protein
MKSGLFKLNWKDVVKGFVVAFISSILTAVVATLQGGGLPSPEEFKTVLIVGLGSGVAYLIKNLFTNDKDEILKPDK